MIILVDDIEEMLSHLKAVLQPHGYEVRGFASAALALQFLADTDPDLIISDIKMPEMDGFEFRRSYTSSFPNRRTPFVFLTALGEERQIIEGLESGVDDYLVKSVSPEILLAKVRSIIQRKQRYTCHEFRGSFEKLTFVDVMLFCESTAFTGVVEAWVPGRDHPGSVEFKLGQICLDDSISNETIEALLDCREGHFVVRPRGLDFSQLAGARNGGGLRESSSSETGCVGAPPGQRHSIGKISGLAIGDHVVEIQTEVLSEPENAVVTTAFLGGRTLLRKRQAPVDLGDMQGLAEVVQAQHRAAAEQVRSRFHDLERRTAHTAESRESRFARLLREGSANYVSGDYPAALAALEQASEIHPNHRLLVKNLEILRRKLAS